MPKISDIPNALKPFAFHNVFLSIKHGSRQAIGDCFVCNKERKLYVNIEKDSLWDCKVCGAKGNLFTFIQKILEISLIKSEVNTSTEDDYSILAKDRGLLFTDTLKNWSIVRSAYTEDWLVPGYNENGKLIQLYKYIFNPLEERMTLIPTPELHHGLHGVNLFNRDKKDVLICEGIWDGMTLWETMNFTQKDDEGNMVPIIDKNQIYLNSLLKDANVLATPSANVFNPAWIPLFQNKEFVYLLFDNDHPRTNPHTVQEIEPAGFGGMKRVSKILSGIENAPKEIRYLRWGGKDLNGEDMNHNPDLKSGYDVRDFLRGVN